MRRNLLQLFPQRTLGEPEVVGLLEPKPDACSVAAELSEADRHLGRDARGFRKDAMKRLAGHPQLPRRFADGQAERGKNVFPKDGSRVRRRASAAFSNQLLRHGLLLRLSGIARDQHEPLRPIPIRTLRTKAH